MQIISLSLKERLYGVRHLKEKSVKISTTLIEVEVHIPSHRDVRPSCSNHPVVKFILVNQSNPPRKDRILS